MNALTDKIRENIDKIKEDRALKSLAKRITPKGTSKSGSHKQSVNETTIKKNKEPGNVQQQPFRNT